MDGIWRLEILIDNGTGWKVHGSEDVLRAAYGELKQAKLEPATAPKIIEVSGMHDTADRAEQTIFVETESVKAADLTKIY
jgi:hypothetical protein